MKLMLSIDRDNLNGPYVYYDLILENFDGHYALFRPNFPPTPSLWLFVTVTILWCLPLSSSWAILVVFTTPTPQYWGSVSTNRHIPHNLLRHITHLSYGQTLVQKTKQKQYEVDKLTLLLTILFIRYKGQTTGY